MTRAIRDGGSQGAITVGQDEAGLGTSPAPLFHHKSVHFTSMHTWWNNDALLWDGVLSKATGTPLLVSETGIMQRHRLSGEAVRSPEEFAALLSRKIAYAFAAGAFGVIQWCYETNPFMNSDNEAAIGAKRVDGSAKPEHAVLAAAAAVRRAQPGALRWARGTRGRARGPDERAPVAAQPRRRRDARGGPRVLRRSRHPVACRRRPSRGPGSRTAAGHRVAGVPLDFRRWLGSDRGGCRTGSDADLVRAGSRPTKRGCPPSGWAAARGPCGCMKRCRAWQARGARCSVSPARYPSRGPPPTCAAPRRISRGAGTIVHHPLPIEWADADAVAGGVLSIRDRSGTNLAPLVDLDGIAPGVLLVTVPFRDAWLLVAVNESSRTRTVIARRPGKTRRVTFEVEAGYGRMAFIDPRAWTLIDLS